MDMNSVQISVTSDDRSNPIVILPNELHILSNDSKQSFKDILLKVSHKSPLLSHILTYIQCQSDAASRAKQNTNINDNDSKLETVDDDNSTTESNQFSSHIKIYGIFGQNNESKCGDN